MKSVFLKSVVIGLCCSAGIAHASTSTPPPAAKSVSICMTVNNSGAEVTYNPSGSVSTSQTLKAQNLYAPTPPCISAQITSGSGVSVGVLTYTGIKGTATCYPTSPTSAYTKITINPGTSAARGCSVTFS